MFKFLFTIFITVVLYITYQSISIYQLSIAVKHQFIGTNDYYIKFDYIKETEAFKLDENNITYINYSKIKSLGVQNGISYNPISIALSGLRFNQNNQQSLFLAQANWLVTHITNDGNWYIMHNKKIGTSVLKAPWNSALSQGLGISVLVRAYLLTKDKKYIITARKALKPFLKSIKKGGIVSQNTFGKMYEEYPLEKNPTHVLNGFIYSLYGLYDLYKFDNNIEAKKLFDDGIQTLKNILQKYDLGYWTLYDLNPNRNLKNHWGYSSPWYQKLYISQLYGLYQITQDKFFLKYSNKFAYQSKNSWINFIIYPSYVLYTDFIKIYRLFQ